MRTIGYVRVSTDKQAEKGVSLEAQAEKIRAMALMLDAELLDIIVDGGESAKSLQRPSITRLLSMVEQTPTSMPTGLTLMAGTPRTAPTLASEQQPQPFFDL